MILGDSVDDLMLDEGRLYDCSTTNCKGQVSSKTANANSISAGDGTKPKQTAHQIETFSPPTVANSRKDGVSATMGSTKVSDTAQQKRWVQYCVCVWVFFATFSL